MLIKHSAELSEKGSFPKSNSLVNKKNKNKNTDWIKNLVLILIIWKGVNLQLIHWILTLWSFSSSEEKCIVTQSCFLLPSKSFVSYLCRKTTLFIPRRYYLQAKVLIIHKISHYRKTDCAERRERRHLLSSCYLLIISGWSSYFQTQRYTGAFPRTPALFMHWFHPQWIRTPSLCVL